MELNGHLPEGAQLVTLELLHRTNTKLVKAPVLSERAGCDVYVRIRPIRRVAYLQMLPPPAPGSESWPEAKPGMSDAERQAVIQERIQRQEAWFQTLPAEERELQRKAVDDVTYKVLVAGIVEPRLTFETARDFADDADIIGMEILIFSGLVMAPKPAETTAQPVAAEATTDVAPSA
jgi:hypothetical protein